MKIFFLQVFGPKMTNFGVATNFKTRSSSVLVKQRQVQLCAWNLLKLYFLIHFLRPLALWNSSLPRRLLHSSGIPRHHPIFSSLFAHIYTPARARDAAGAAAPSQRSSRAPALDCVPPRLGETGVPRSDPVVLIGWS